LHSSHFVLKSLIEMSSITLSTMLSDESLSSHADDATIPFEEFGYTSFVVEKATLCDNAIAIKPSILERSLLPRVYRGSLPHQSDCTRWLKYLLGLVIVKIAILLITTELTTRILLKRKGSDVVSNFVAGIMNDSWATSIMILMTLLAIASVVVNDVMTFVFLLHGKRRRSLPAKDRLVHAVIVTQYKEVRHLVGSLFDSNFPIWELLISSHWKGLA
jgi:hypothetical protein